MQGTRRAIRIGLRYVRNLGDGLLERIGAARAEGPFTDMEDFTRRTAAPTDALEALAMAGAFTGCFGLARRDALWRAGALRDARPERLGGLVTGLDAPRLPALAPVEEAAADLWSMGLSPDAHPTQFVREMLDRRGALTIAALAGAEPNSVVEVAGDVTHRQRPSTARGIVFLSLEDETGLLNVICPEGLWRRHRRVARTAPALVVRGLLERHQGVTNLIAHRLEALAGVAPPRSRDFR